MLKTTLYYGILHVAKKYVRCKAIWCERSFVLSFL